MGGNVTKKYYEMTIFFTGICNKDSFANVYSLNGRGKTGSEL
jgi:hypothetical protein